MVPEPSPWLPSREQSRGDVGPVDATGGGGGGVLAAPASLAERAASVSSPESSSESSESAAPVAMAPATPAATALSSMRAGCASSSSSSSSLECSESVESSSELIGASPARHAPGSVRTAEHAATSHSLRCAVCLSSSLRLARLSIVQLPASNLGGARRARGITSARSSGGSHSGMSGASLPLSCPAEDPPLPLPLRSRAVFTCTQSRAVGARSACATAHCPGASWTTSRSPARGARSSVRASGSSSASHEACASHCAASLHSNSQGQDTPVGKRRHLRHRSHCTLSAARQAPLLRSIHSLLTRCEVGLNQHLTTSKMTWFCLWSLERRHLACLVRLSRMAALRCSFHSPATVHS
mmetsp:Transcript_7658/g.20935  ORF Transcript_7658/g.20935 Transcript_7658/m.20935 type:complete len:355 (+) Transcript_7658:783-1847(+)